MAYSAPTCTGAVRTYRAVGCSSGEVTTSTPVYDTYPPLLTLANPARMRIQNIGSQNLWLNWNAAAVADQCMLLAAGDVIELEQYIDDLELWYVSAPVATDISVLYEH